MIYHIQPRFTTMVLLSRYFTIVAYYLLLFINMFFYEFFINII